MADLKLQSALTFPLFHLIVFPAQHLIYNSAAFDAAKLLNYTIDFSNLTSLVVCVIPNYFMVIVICPGYRDSNQTAT